MNNDDIHGPAGVFRRHAAGHPGWPGPFTFQTGFLGSGEFEPGAFVLYGVGLDDTTSFRPGTRFGPGAIRESSVGLEEFSPLARRSLTGLAFADFGDLAVVPGRLVESLGEIRRAARTILAAGGIPLLLGGEHLATLPAVQAVAEQVAGLMVLHFDAHADLRDTFGGMELSHATVMRRVSEVVGRENLVQVGIRSWVPEEWAYARHSGGFFPVEPAAAADAGEGEDGWPRLYPGFTAALAAALPLVAGRPVYVSIDIDVVDPSEAPGTGVPEPGGARAYEIWQGLAAVRRMGVRIAGADVVEVAPAYDPTGRTAIVAARIVRELVCLFAPFRRDDTER